jgi:hypothetical protein
MRSPALIASGFILHNKKNFVHDPLAPSLALCRPCPSPLQPRSIFARKLRAASKRPAAAAGGWRRHGHAAGMH